MRCFSAVAELLVNDHYRIFDDWSWFRYNYSVLSTLLTGLSQEPAEQSTIPICSFCKTNSPRDVQAYTGHVVKDETGKVTCHVLRSYVCPQCGATGDQAHTIKYCSRRPENVMANVRQLKTTARNACKSCITLLHVSARCFLAFSSWGGVVELRSVLVRLMTCIILRKHTKSNIQRTLWAIRVVIRRGSQGVLYESWGVY